MYGRHGEAPVPIVAAMTPSHCFEVAIEAARIAVKYRTPVIVLSDGYLANGAEPWRLPDPATLPDLQVEFATETNHTDEDGTAGVLALRPRRGDPGPAVGRARHARARAPHRRPREGGRLGQRLLRPRQPRAHGAPARRQGGRHRRRHPAPRGRRPRRRRRRPRARPRVGLDLRGHRGRASAGCGPAGCRWPTPISSTSTRSRATWATVLAAYDKVLVPEANLGQLAKMVRADFLVDARSLTKVQGVPFRAAEIEEVVLEMLGATSGTTIDEEDVAS